MVVDVHPQVLCNLVVHAFDLGVRLGVVSRRDVPLNSQHMANVTHKLARELGTPIRYDLLRDAEEREDLFAVQGGELRGSQGHRGRDGYHHLRQMVHDVKDGIVTL